MKMTQLKRNGEVVIPYCRVATDFMSRFKGLMGVRIVNETEAILFPKCSSVHTFFMRIPIDVLFLDKIGRVVGLAESVRPWRLLLPRRRAYHIVELKAGLSRFLGIQVGTKLECKGMWV